jgi:hypothetical protein
MSWRNYPESQLAALTRPPSFSEDQSERLCPACGNMTVRQYVYLSYERQRPAIIGYVWCRSCQHFAGSVGPAPGGLVFSDPFQDLDDDQRLDMEEDLGVFFGRLDQCWDDGALPQRFGDQ